MCLPAGPPTIRFSRLPTENINKMCATPAHSHPLLTWLTPAPHPRILNGVALGPWSRRLGLDVRAAYADHYLSHRESELLLSSSHGFAKIGYQDRQRTVDGFKTAWTMPPCSETSFNRRISDDVKTWEAVPPRCMRHYRRCIMSIVRRLFQLSLSKVRQVQEAMAPRLSQLLAPLRFHLRTLRSVSGTVHHDGEGWSLCSYRARMEHGRGSRGRGCGGQIPGYRCRPSRHAYAGKNTSLAGKQSQETIAHDRNTDETSASVISASSLSSASAPSSSVHGSFSLRTPAPCTPDDSDNTLTKCERNLLFAVTDGGTGGLFWGFTVAIIACVFIYLSMAEMASM